MVWINVSKRDRDRGRRWKVFRQAWSTPLLDLGGAFTHSTLSTLLLFCSALIKWKCSCVPVVLNCFFFLPFSPLCILFSHPLHSPTQFCWLNCFQRQQVTLWWPLSHFLFFHIYRSLIPFLSGFFPKFLSSCTPHPSISVSSCSAFIFLPHVSFSFPPFSPLDPYSPVPDISTCSVCVCLSCIKACVYNNTCIFVPMVFFVSLMVFIYMCLCANLYVVYLGFLQPQWTRSLIMIKHYRWPTGFGIAL